MPCHLTDTGEYRTSVLGSNHKNQSTKYSVQTLHFSGRGSGLEVPPDYKVLSQGWGLQKESVSVFPSYFRVSIFSVAQCAGVSQLVSVYLSA